MKIFFGNVSGGLRLIVCAVFTVTALFGSGQFRFESDALFSLPSDLTVFSEAVYLVNTDTDIVVYEKNPYEKQYPASVTKIMTAIVVLENTSDLNVLAEVTTRATDEFWLGDPNKEGASNAALIAGQDITYEALLYGLLLPSACDAANALAINVAGDVPTFVKMMNAKAEELGCINTHFSNAHGLFEEENYSCAYDIYLISKYAMYDMPERAKFNEIVSAEEYQFPANKSNPSGYKKYNTNNLIIPPDQYTENEYYYEYATGVKTGSFGEIYRKNEAPGKWEKSSGYAFLVSTATKSVTNDIRYNYICVSLGAPYYVLEGDTKEKVGKKAHYSFRDHINLYEWAFSTILYKTVLTKEAPVTDVKIVNGDGVDILQLLPIMDFATLLPASADITAVQKKVTQKLDPVDAPVTKGEILGRVQILLGGEVLTEIDLVAAGDVPKSQTVAIKEQAKTILHNVLGSKQLFALIIVLVMLCIGLAVLKALSYRRARAARRFAAKAKRDKGFIDNYDD
ncbi:MAG: hypothetical protein LBN42_03345 [Oscillospiraceae bacterium]|jgi:D-alanyl-D-alanine carboxypeptidase (penicillin-binding protein 5/6)|nr:hypothetical protein [Oscillospiraceae bacterium]